MEIKDASNKTRHRLHGGLKLLKKKAVEISLNGLKK
jgi:hypothetical protein